MKSQIISNPVLEDDFLIKYKKPKNNDKKTNKRIIIIGRYVPQKRIDHAVKAFFLVQKKISNCKLTIVGDGPGRQKILHLINQYQIMDKVKLIDFCPDVPRLLGEFDCMISTSKFEGFGNVLIEGLAFCDNLIAYKSIGGASELLIGTNAILIEDGNINKLADAMIDILSQDFHHRTASKKYLSNFTVSKVGEEYLSFIADVANEN